MILDIIGISGVVIGLLNYFLLQTERVQSSHLIYPLLNLIGGILILVSLFKDWNLSAFVMQIAWVAISIWGISTILQNNKKS